MKTIPLDLPPAHRELVKRALEQYEKKLKGSAKVDDRLELETEGHQRRRGAVLSAKDAIQEQIDNAPDLRAVMTIWLEPEHRMAVAIALRVLWRDIATLGDREQLLLGSNVAANQEQDRIDRILEALNDQTVLELDGVKPEPAGVS